MRRAVLSAVLAAAMGLPLPGRAEEFTTYKGHGGPVMGLDVSAQGRLASASFDNSVGLWDGQQPRWLEGHRAAVVTVNYTLAPYLLSGGDDYRVLLWHPDWDAPRQIATHQGKVADIATHQGQIATAGWDGAITLIDAPSAPPGQDFSTKSLVGHQSSVTAVGFAPDGLLYSASSDGTLRVWEDGRPRTLVRHGFGINRLVVTADWIAYGAVDGGTRIITRDGAALADLTLDRRPILAMDHHPETGQLAVGDGHGYIMMIDTATWRIARDFRAMRRGPVWALAFSADGATILAGGIDDVIYAWPIALLDQFDPAGPSVRSFLRDADSMPNGERQFMRKCSICHALTAGASRKAGPTLHKLFGRRAGTVAGYSYSQVLDGSAIIWSDDTIDALFDIGPDHFIPGSKMPMQVIAAPQDRLDLISYLRQATK